MFTIFYVIYKTIVSQLTKKDIYWFILIVVTGLEIICFSRVSAFF